MAASLGPRSRPQERCRISRHRRVHGHDRKGLEYGHPLDWQGRRADFAHHELQSDSPHRSPRQILRPPHTLKVSASWSTFSPRSQQDYSKPFVMERTPSGNSIISDISFEPCHKNTLWTSDSEAARQVQEHYNRIQRIELFPDEQPERILRGLINSQETVDDVALDGIMSAANHVFFHEALTGRVNWEWSHPSQERYMTELVGSTALRYANPRKGGVETLIVLSTPLLKIPNTDRRLVLCAFLHELIHCYLFIQCGFGARIKGGHTDGFETIAAIIDEWIGPGVIPICNMKADLDHFRDDRMLSRRGSGYAREKSHSHPGCNQSVIPRHDDEGAIFVRQVGRHKHVYI